MIKKKLELNSLAERKSQRKLTVKSRYSTKLAKKNLKYLKGSKQETAGPVYKFLDIRN